MPAGTNAYTVTGKWTVGAAPTDVAALKCGSRPIRIVHIYVAASQTAGAAAIVDVVPTRRSTANTAGTITAKTPSKHNTLAPASDAAFNLYTAPPTGLGAAAGEFRTIPLSLGVGASTGIVEAEFDSNTIDGLFLQPGEFLALNTAGLPNAATFRATIRYIEI